MEVKFIGQGYNLGIGTSVAEELIELFTDTNYNSFRCLVAFATPSGVLGLAPHIQQSKAHISTFDVIVGIHQKATSKEALEELMKLEIDASIYYFRTRGIIFHPKIYFFKGPDKSAIIVGSNNFTKSGLSKNIESSILIKIENESTEGVKLLQEIENYYESMFNHTDSNVQRISDQLVEKLLAANIIPTESQRAALYEAEDKVDTESALDTQTDINDIFSTVSIQPLPTGFSGSRRSAVLTQPANVAVRQRPIGPSGTIAPPRTASPVQETQLTPVNANFNSSQVLVAEISGGDRWSQANFDLATFQGFFGATRGDNSYYISLTHVDSHGNLEDEVQSQAVTVQSSNYRFELRAAHGVPFPSDGYPLAVFIKQTSQKFLYRIFMPQDPNYDSVKEFLDTNFTGPATRRKRVITTVNELKQSCPDLPLWN